MGAMARRRSKAQFFPIPAKRYFTIGEVSALCGVKPYVVYYWEQEFTQLNPEKREGNRRHYQHDEVVFIRRIRELLYEDGFTIRGARRQLERVSSTNKVEPVTTNRHAPSANGFGVTAIARELRSLLDELQS
jgi:DNA-binding transcriptional MerR regulator